MVDVTDEAGPEGGLVLPAVTRACAVIVVVVAVSVLVGWVADIDVLLSVATGAASMKVNTAITLLAIALSMLVPWPAARWAALVLAGSICLVTAVEHLAHVDLGIDELLMQDASLDGNNAPGRPALSTALAALLLVVGRWSQLRGRRTRVPGWAAGLAAFIGGVTVIAYALAAERLYGLISQSTMAVHTGIAIVLLALALAASIPDGVVARAVLGEGPGPTVIRRIVPVGLIAIPVAGFLTGQGIRTEVFGDRFGLAVMVALTSTILIAFSVQTAFQLDRVDLARRTAMAGLRTLNSQLKHGRDAEWRRAEELSKDLIEERGRFERAIAKVDDLLWTVEYQADGSTSTVFASPNAAGIFGGPLPEGLDLEAATAAMVHSDDRARYRWFHEELSHGRPAEVEVRLDGVDGTQRWVWLRAVPRDEGGRHFSDGISTNITQQREFAAQREALLALERDRVAQLHEIGRLREEFLAVTGHELRTPLTSIRGFADLLVNDPGLSPDQRLKAEVIARRAVQLGRLIDNLFDVTRLNAGMLELSTTLVALDDLVQEAVDAIAPSATAAGLGLVTRIDRVTVEADPVRMRQVIDNLLSNAVKYTPTGGTVTVSVTAQAPDAAVAVADTGIGLTPEERDKVFDRLFRSPAARELAISGTGLGLSISKGLVEAHGGTLTVVENPGGGSVFTVRVPLARLGSPTQKAAQRPVRVPGQVMDQVTAQSGSPHRSV